MKLVPIVDEDDVILHLVTEAIHIGILLTLLLGVWTAFAPLRLAWLTTLAHPTASAHWPAA
jgi:hypothetical protein